MTEQLKKLQILTFPFGGAGEWGADPTEKTINADAVLPIDLQP